jgi:cation-transporting ATPase E
VAIKVISGDHPRTVAAVAVAAGVPGAGEREPVDARQLPDDEEGLARALDDAVVFGRVMPEQKRAMVRALQSRRHVVAMTGDGVNDALALKDADLGVAMGSGAPATRAVAELVLLDGQFAHLPVVVAEGRRVIANVERVARLFVSKNVMAALLTIAVVVASLNYPFKPRHLTVFSALTIGIPAFVLALAPNARRYVPGFLRRVVEFSLPIGAVLAASVMVIYGISEAEDGSVDEGRSAALVTAMVVGLAQLVMVSRPVRGWKLGLVLAMGGAFVGLLALPLTRDALDVDLPAPLAVQALVVGGVGAVMVVVLGLLVDRRERRMLEAASG